MKVRRFVDRYHLRRPTLRMQLALLYAGLFVILCLGVLAVSGLLIQRASRGVNGLPGPLPPTGHVFAIVPAVVALVGAGMALALGWWFAGRFLRPLRTMNTTANEISVTNLSQRLGLQGPEDEITELAKTLDGLFGRLEESFESQRHFVANASHELRTPLTAERTLLQVALADPDASAETLRAACEEVLRLNDDHARLIEALLTLASSERGIDRLETVDLASVVVAAVAGRREEAGRAGLEVDMRAEGAPISGDVTLVESLVSNLLDNAIRHNVTGGSVEIMTGTTGGHAVLSIRNTGEVIPANDVERLFQPFRQLGGERIRRGPGHGLGLAIVEAIVRAHGGTVTAMARPAGGLAVEVSFRAV